MRAIVRAALLGVALPAFAIVAAAAGPAPAGASSPSPAPSALTYRIGIGQDYDGMNPFASWSGISWECFRLGYDFLTWYDADYEPVPDVATSWETSEDGKTWTFHIREGMKWQDGAAAHRARRGLHLQPHPGHAALGVHPVPDRRHRRDGAGRRHRGHHHQRAQRRHARALHPDPSGAHLEEGRPRPPRLVQEHALRGLGPVPGGRAPEEQVGQARGQPRLPGGARRPADAGRGVLRHQPEHRLDDRGLQGAAASTPSSTSRPPTRRSSPSCRAPRRWPPRPSASTSWASTAGRARRARGTRSSATR